MKLAIILSLVFSTIILAEPPGRGGRGRDPRMGPGPGGRDRGRPWHWPPGFGQPGRPPGPPGQYWRGHRSDGDACANGVTVLESGDAMSVLFADFQINMPMGDPGGDGLMKRKTCHFSTNLTPPAGMMLAGFRQLFSGGMIKSNGAQARLSISYRLGGPPMGKMMQWNLGEVINPDSPQSLFTQSFNDPLSIGRNRCRDVQQYDLRMEIIASRRDRTDYLVGGLDSLDTEIVPSVSVQPLWQPCR